MKVQVSDISRLDICLVSTKIKNIKYSDEELDEEEVVSVEIPLRKPVLNVIITMHTTTDALKVGSIYSDENGNHYMATLSETLVGNFKATAFKMPEYVFCIQSPIKEG